MTQYYSGQPSPSTAPDWFIGDQIVTPPPSPQRGKKLLIILAILFGVGIVIAGIAVLAMNAQKPQCLTTKDYREFTGENTVDDIDATQNFFTYPVEFKPNSTSYDESEPPKIADVLKAFGLFYKDHSAIPHTYTLTAPRAVKEEWSLAQDRMDILQAGLIAQGIPAENIIQTPLVVPNIAPLDEDDEGSSIDLDTVTVRITSTQACGK